VIQYTRLHAAGRGPYRYTRRKREFPFPRAKMRNPKTHRFAEFCLFTWELALMRFIKISVEECRDKDKKRPLVNFFGIKETVKYSFNRALRFFDKINKIKANQIR